MLSAPTKPTTRDGNSEQIYERHVVIFKGSFYMYYKRSVD